MLQGQESIACKEVGYVLRTLGQNPTEDEVIALVCEAGCDWEGNFTCDDFLKVAVASVQKQVNRLDDVRAAFRYVKTYIYCDGSHDISLQWCSIKTLGQYISTTVKRYSEL